MRVVHEYKSVPMLGPRASDHLPPARVVDGPVLARHVDFKKLLNKILNLKSLTVKLTIQMHRIHLYIRTLLLNKISFLR